MEFNLKKGTDYSDKFPDITAYFPFFKLILSHIHMCPSVCSKYFLLPAVKHRILVHMLNCCPRLLFLLNQTAF